MTNQQRFNSGLKDLRLSLMNDGYVFYRMLKKFGFTDADIARELNVAPQAVSRKYKQIREEMDRK